MSFGENILQFGGIRGIVGEIIAKFGEIPTPIGEKTLH